MKRVRSFLFGLSAGSLLGAILGIMLAPASGEQMRHQLRDSAERIQIEIRHAAETRRAELQRELDQLRSTGR
ncbi:MAG: YtxH domain-containing protein [Anaerolineales bacterium]|nr:YtxH domain-containing protein [Anaerolineales bacterium]